MSKDSHRLEGIPLSQGIAFGRIHILRSDERSIPQYYVGARQAKQEIERLRNALLDAKGELHAARQRLKRLKQLGPSMSVFFDLYEALLEDETLTKNAEDRIRKSKVNAEWALQERASELAADFESIDSKYLRERKHDIEHVAAKIIQAMQPSPETVSKPARGAGQGRILATRNISPTDVLEYAHRGYEAFVTETGGPNSHAAIIARGLRVPFLGKVEGLLDSLQEEDPALLNAVDGMLVVRPSESMIRSGRAKRKSCEVAASHKRIRRRKARTLDGVDVSLQANIELLEEISEAVDAGADEIGLFRTESLPLTLSKLPSEDEQYDLYLNALQRGKDRTITFRTFDVGSDKLTADISAGDESTSSPLGLRAIRYCLSKPQVFLTQLRALLRVSAHGPMRIMLPMLTSPSELSQALGLLRIAKEQLSNRSLGFSPEVEIGAMIEVPASVFVMEEFARHLDFFSIGTNDLIQYMLAVDREDEKVATLNDPHHPAIVHMLNMISDKARRHRKPLTLCGEMAGDPLFTPLFLCLGLRRLSMQADRIGQVQAAIKQADTRRLGTLKRRVLAAPTPEAVSDTLKAYRGAKGG